MAVIYKTSQEILFFKIFKLYIFAASSEAIADSVLSFFSEINLADPAVSAEIIGINL